MRKRTSKLPTKMIMLSLIVGLLQFNSNFTLANEQSFIQISLEQGLSQATINSIAQDKQGYIWIGTQDGLNRYDGYRMLSFFHHPSDPYSLSHNFVSKIIIDDTDQIWILTANGIDRYDRFTDRFIRYRDDKFNTTFFNQIYLWSMQEGTNNNLWITTTNGLLEFNKASGQYKHYPSGPEFGIAAKNTYALQQINKSTFVVASDKGLFTNASNHFFLENIPLGELDSNTKEPRLYCISNVIKGTYFLCSRNGLYYFHKNQFHFISNEALGLSAQSKRILLTENNEIWIGTVSGLYIKSLDFKSPNFKSLNFKSINNSLRKTKRLTLIDNSITELKEDKDGVIWVGTNISGLFKILPTSRAFSHYSANDKSQKKIANNLVTTISEKNRDSVWVGDSRGGVTIISNYESRRLIFLKNSKGQEVYHTILDIAFDALGFAWITNALGVTKLDENGDQLAFYQLKSSSNNTTTYATQLILSHGELWATGLDSGLLRFDTASKNFVPIIPTNWQSAQPFAKMVYSAIVKNDIMWLAGYQGILYQYNLKTKAAEQYLMRESGAEHYAISQIYHLHEDTQGYLWVSGMGGLGRFDTKTNAFKHMTKSNAFGAKTYYSALEDSAGYIWTTPANKLIRLDPKNSTLLAFDRSLGMPIIEFSPAAIVDSNQKIWLGGLNGLTVFDPLLILTPKGKLTPVLNDLYSKSNALNPSLEKKWKRIPRNYHEAHSLSPEERSLKFTFSVLDFSQNSNLRYRFRLLGYENLWNQSESGSPQAIYTNLPFGDYQLEVSTSFDGVNWKPAKTIASVSISPYFWETNYFKLGLALTLLLFSYCLYLFFIRHSKIRSKALESVVDTRTKEISSLLKQRTRFFSFVSHELKTPLTLIQDPLQQLRKSHHKFTGNDEKYFITALRNVGRLSSLVERLLSFEYEDLKAPLGKVSVTQLISEAIIQLNDFAANKKVKLIQRRMASCSLNVRRSDIESVIYNLLSNAIKYNKDHGKVYISCVCSKSKVVIFIIDEGNGFSKNGDSSDNQNRLNINSAVNAGGYGLPLVNQSVDAMSGCLKIRSHKTKGTAIAVFIPLNSSESNVSKSGIFEQGQESRIETESKEKLETTDKPILFLVEDSKALRNYLQDILSKTYDFYSFSNAESALGSAIKTVPDIILSDILLPGMSGTELCAKIKSNETTSHIPVLLLTAKSDQASINAGLKHAATDYLTKPFNSEELGLRIANLIKLTRQIYDNANPLSLALSSLKTPNTQSELGEKDLNFIQRLTDVMRLNYIESDYNLDCMSADLFMSKKQLSRKLKAICQQSPMEFLKIYRLERSIELINQGVPLSEVAVACGFSSQSYFSTCFKNQFQQTPKQFQIQMQTAKRESHQNQIPQVD